VVKPAPMVARAPVAPVQEYVEEQAEEHYEEPAQIEMPAHRPAVQQRIPAIDQFPMIAQKQVAAQQSRIENIAEHAQRKKKGLFERLADVGLGRREEPAPAPREQAPLRRAEPQMQPRAAAQEPQALAEQTYDDDQLAIPAFLRRQANS
jgi:cell division protein FtsZ